MRNLYLVFLSLIISSQSYGKTAVNGPVAGATSMQRDVHAPFSFITNIGQITDQQGQPRNDVQFELRTEGGLNIFVGSGAIHYQFCRLDSVVGGGAAPHSALSKSTQQQPRPYYSLYRMDVKLVGANNNAEVITGAKGDYYESYYTPGTDGKRNIAGTCGLITYKEVYPHIDWVLSVKDGKLEHEFLIHKGGKISDIKLEYGGATSLERADDGKLIARTPFGNITENAPVTYQLDGRSVESHYAVSGNKVKYEAGNYDGELIIDPSLSWFLYYGDTATMHQTWSLSVAADNAGNIYMSGLSSATSLIATTGAYQATYAGGTDAFLAKFNSAGLIQWGTYYGGTQGEWGYGVAVDNSGNIYVAGTTESSSGISSTGSFQPAFAGGYYDAFLVKFNPLGIRQWATYYGDTMEDEGRTVCVDAAGYVYMAGFTRSPGLATAGSYQSTLGGGFDDFLVKFDNAGNRIWGTFYGGSGTENWAYLAADNSGNVYLAGCTTSPDGIASAGSYQSTSGGGAAGNMDAFLAKFDGSGTRLWGTYYGASGNDAGDAVAADKWGNVYITGASSSTDSIATPGSYQSSIAGYQDVFVAKFNGSGVRQWGTYYGGPYGDEAVGIATDTLGEIYLTGFTTSSSGIATPDAYQPTFVATDYDAFIATFDTGGAVRHYGTYFGTTHFQEAVGVTIDNSANAYVCGFIGNLVVPYEGPASGYVRGFLLKFGHLAPITGNIPLCLGSNITLSDDSTGGTWSSGNLTVASIGSLTGIVHGVSAGTAVITYTLGSGTVVTIVSVSAAPGAITGLLSRCVGYSSALGDAAAYGTWTSSNIAVGTIDASCMITGIGAGTTIVSYTNACGTATAVYTVSPMPSNIGGPLNVCVGASVTLTDTASGGTWSSSNIAIGSIGTASGILTGITAGTAVVYYTFPGCMTGVVVTVNMTPGPITGVTNICPSTSITLIDPVAGGLWISTNTSVAIAGSLTGLVTGITAGTSIISYANACGTVTAMVNVGSYLSPIVGSGNGCVGGDLYLSDTLTDGIWSSSNPVVAPIPSLTSGSSYPLSAGTAIISYTTTCGTVTRSVTVNAAPGPITGPTSVCVGGNIALSDSITGGTWSSTYSTVTVGATTGIVHGVTAGGGMITYTTPCGSVYYYINIVTAASPISGAATVCVGGTVLLADPSYTGTWSSGNTSIATIGSASGALTGVATGTVIISYTNACGSATTTVNVSGTLPPITGGDSVCAGSSITLSDAMPGGIWSGGYAYVITVGSTTGVVTGIVWSIETITYTTACGYVTTPFTVNPMPSATYFVSGGTATATALLCLGASAPMYNSATGGLWTSSDPTVVSVGSSTGIVTGLATGTARITYTIPCGISTLVVTVSPTLAPITGSTLICMGAPVHLSDLTVGGTWSSSASTIAYIDYTGTVYGEASGTATITYTTACGRTTTVVSVSPAIAAITGPSGLCPGTSISLTDVPAGGLWSSSDPTVAVVGSSGVVSGTVVGTTLITYTVMCGFAIKEVTVSVTPSQITGVTNFCLGTSTALTDSIAGGTWSSSNTSVAIVASTTGVVTAVSLGTATITYTSPCGTITTTVTVNPAVGPIVGPLTVCLGTTITLSDAVGGGNWDANPYFTAHIGPFSGVLTGTSSGTVIVSYTAVCGTATTVVTVSATTVSYISGIVPICPGVSITLSDLTTGGNWSSSNSTIATIGSATGIVAAVSSGTANITYTTACGSVTAIQTVSPVPAAIAGTSAICVGSSASLYDAVAGGTWSSSNPSVGSVGSASGVVLGGSSGTAVITYANSCGYVTTTVTVTGAPSGIVGASAVCQGATTVETDATSGGTWSSSTSIASIGSDGTVTGTTVGTAIISYVAACGYTTKTLTVVALTSAISGPLTVCTGFHITLSDAASGGTWASSDITIATVGTASGIVSGITSGTTIITYTGMCGTATAVVTVVSTPSAIAGVSSLCAGNTTALTDVTTGGTWSSSDILVAAVGSSTGIVSGLASGTTIIIYVAACGTVTRSITVNPLPSAIPGAGSLAVCTGLTITLSDTAGGGTWSSSDTSMLHITPSGTATGTIGGTVTVTYTLPTGCMTTAIVTVDPSPGTITGAVAVCPGMTVNLSDAISGGTWSSSDASVVTVGSSSGIVSTIGAGTAIMSYALSTGCSTATIVTVNPLPALITGADTVCVGNTLLLDDISTGGTWSGSNTSVATIDSLSGLVTGLLTGTLTITYTLPTGCFVASGMTVENCPLGVVSPNNPYLDVTVSPNPNLGTFTVRGTTGLSEDAKIRLEIIDLLGKTVYSSLIDTHMGTFDETILLKKELVNSMYILNVKTATLQKSIYFVVER